MLHCKATAILESVAIRGVVIPASNFAIVDLGISRCFASCSCEENPAFRLSIAILVFIDLIFFTSFDDIVPIWNTLTRYIVPVKNFLYEFSLFFNHVLFWNTSLCRYIEHAISL